MHNKANQNQLDSNTLILGAYLEECELWKQKVQKLIVENSNQLVLLDDIKAEFYEMSKAASVAHQDLKNESRFKQTLFNMFGFFTKKQKATINLAEKCQEYFEIYDKESVKLNDLVGRLHDAQNNPPPTTNWELAIMGNDLFKS